MCPQQYLLQRIDHQTHQKIHSPEIVKMHPAAASIISSHTHYKKRNFIVNEVLISITALVSLNWELILHKVL
jgi:hypothetical protein